MSPIPNRLQTRELGTPALEPSGEKRDGWMGDRVERKEYTLF